MELKDMLREKTLVEIIAERDAMILSLFKDIEKLKVEMKDKKEK